MAKGSKASTHKNPLDYFLRDCSYNLHRDYALSDLRTRRYFRRGTACPERPAGEQ